MFQYTVVVEYFDKNHALRTVRKTVEAKSQKEAASLLKKLGKINKIMWEQLPDNPLDKQLEFFNEGEYNKGQNE